jgi:hypothetical protein
MSIYDLYGTDTSLENEGMWIGLKGDIKIKITYFGNKKNKSYLEKLRAPYKTQIRKGTLDPSIEEELTLKAMSRFVLVDWEGMTTQEGKELPYSVENAYQILKELPHFANEVADLSTSMDTFRAEQIEDAVKNSEKSSSGRSNSDKTKS